MKQRTAWCLGKPLYFATAMPFGADAIGILAESHEGRPTNVAGNPDHPSSLGGIDPIVQASVLNLYDPDRAQTVTYAGEIRTWAAFLDSAQAIAAATKSGRHGIPDPDRNNHIADYFRPNPGVAQAVSAGEVASMGAGGERRGPRGREAGVSARYVNTVLRPARAEVILSLDSDFLASGPGHLRYMKQFYQRRKLEAPADVATASGEMNRLYVVEPTPTVTGSGADHRLPLRASEIEGFARALAAKVNAGGDQVAPPAGSEKWLDAAAKDLLSHRGSSLVVAGEQQSAVVHALVHAINAALGNVGNSVYLHRAGGSHAGQSTGIAA